MTTLVAMNRQDIERKGMGGGALLTLAVEHRVVVRQHLHVHAQIVSRTVP
jgi:hypothetical protein